MAAREYQLEIDAIDATLISIEKVLDLPKLRKQAAELEVEAGVPNLWDDPEAAGDTFHRCFAGDRSRLMLDIDGFRAGRKKELKKLAEDMAEEAKSTGNSIKLKPMNAFERKIIHDTIQDLGLSSESDGEDPNRFVVIYPA